MTDLFPICWFCNEPISPESILVDGFLSPRSAKEGGPLRILGCPACGHAVGAERNAAGDFLLVPVEDLGLAGRVGALFDAERAMLRAHARSWFRTHAERRREFHDVPPPPRRERPETPPRPEDATGSERRTSNRDGRSQTDSQKGTRSRQRRPAPPTIEELYVRLELEPGDDAAAIARAFRRLSKRCHPDKVAHLDEDFQALAHRKFLSLQEAHDGLMRHLNSSDTPRVDE